MFKVAEFLTRLTNIGLRRPSDLRHVFGVANAAAAAILDPEADVRNFAVVRLEDIAPGRRFAFELFSGAQASITLLEAGALAALMACVNARRVFEFGTYKGVSTTQLALNLPPDGVVFSLDLPSDIAVGELRTAKAEERMIAAEAGKGSLVPDELRSQIVFLEADSAHFDTSPYAGTMDLVFVDGAHSFEYVKNDTMKALQLLRLGGCVAWHDCRPNHPEVVKFLKQSHLDVRLVHDTALAYAIIKKQ